MPASRLSTSSRSPTSYFLSSSMSLGMSSSAPKLLTQTLHSSPSPAKPNTDCPRHLELDFHWKLNEANEFFCTHHLPLHYPAFLSCSRPCSNGPGKLGSGDWSGSKPVPASLTIRRGAASFAVAMSEKTACVSFSTHVSMCPRVYGFELHRRCASTSPAG